MLNEKNNTQFFEIQKIDLSELDISSLQNLSNQLDDKKNKYVFKRKIKISISSNYTTNFISKILKLLLINKKIFPEIIESEFDSLKFDTIDFTRKIWKSNSDFLFFMPSYLNLLHTPKIYDDKKTILKNAKKEVNFWKKVWKQTDKTIIQTTYDPPFYSSLGYDDSVKYGGLHHYIRLVNSLLIDSAPSNLSFIDIESLLINNKESSWKDSRMFYFAKQPFNMEIIPALTKAITSRIEGDLGISKKVIVSDLDNTLWGGVLGDDGKYGIICNNSSPDGEAYFNFQKYLKKLSTQGIVLTICSKNDEKFVKEVFKDNKNLALKYDDFSVIKANYDDKAKNIKEIAKILNLNLDSFVFIDDSKIECALVRKILPQVQVINLDSSEPSNYINKIESYNLFNFKNITKEDLNRIESYKKIKKYEDSKTSSSNIEDFLSDLKPKLELNKINSKSVTRSNQLLGKTNQFKFNSTILSEKELLKIKDRTIVLSFQDKFQNYGIIGLLIYELNKKNKTFLLKNWVMSCRVFSRRIEDFIIDFLIKIAKKNKCKNLEFNFTISPKNIYLQNFLKQLNLKISDRKNKYLIKISDIKNTKKSFIKLYNNL